MDTVKGAVFRSRISRSLVVALAAGGLALAAPVAAASASTAHPRSGIGGRIEAAGVRQDAHGSTTVTGWALDWGQPSAAVVVTIVINTHTVARFRTNTLVPHLNSKYGISGNHGFTWHAMAPIAHTLVVSAYPVVHGEIGARITTRFLNGYTPTGARIMAEVAKHVGQRYVYGAAGPTAFDCSGLTSYVYSRAHVTALPHSAEGQRERVRLIPARQALPGDLIFFLSGGSAYHVAIYAGAGYDYAAVDPAEGVRYQRLWTSAVQYGTTWH